AVQGQVQSRRYDDLQSALAQMGFAEQLAGNRPIRALRLKFNRPLLYRKTREAIDEALASGDVMRLYLAATLLRAEGQLRGFTPEQLDEQLTLLNRKTREAFDQAAADGDAGRLYMAAGVLRAEAEQRGLSEDAINQQLSDDLEEGAYW